MDMITLTIDGKKIATWRGTRSSTQRGKRVSTSPPSATIRALLPIGSCRLCVVEVEGYNEPMTACTTPAMDGISVTTQSENSSG